MTDDMSNSQNQNDSSPDAQHDFEVMEPSKYSVLLHNDDFTTQDFVIQVLVQFFYKSETEAHKIMLQVHNSGKGLCGIFTKDVAETKVYMVHQAAKENNFPLKCSMEPESDV